MVDPTLCHTYLGRLQKAPWEHELEACRRAGRAVQDRCMALGLPLHRNTGLRARAIRAGAPGAQRVTCRREYSPASRPPGTSRAPR